MRNLPALMALNGATAIPMSFFAVGLPTLLREAGAPLVLIGLTAIVYLPFALAFLWAPLVDRPGPFGMCRRRFWTLATLLPMATLSLLGAAFDPGTQLVLILALSFLISAGGATLRTTVLGLAVETLDHESRPWGAALIPAGGAIGALIGATGLLLVYGMVGWAGAMTTMALLLTLLIMPALMLSETSVAANAPKLSLRTFFEQPGNRQALAFVTPIALGLGLGFGMMQPRLVDLGFSVEEIGLINGLFTCIALFTGGPAAAAAVRRFGLARVVPWGLCLVIAALGYAAAISLFDLPRLHAAASVVTFFLAFSFLSVMTTLIFMERCGTGREGTDFTIFICAYWLLSMLGMIGSGILAGAFGYAAAFGAGALVALLALPLAPRLHRPELPA